MKQNNIPEIDIDVVRKAWNISSGLIIMDRSSYALAKEITEQSRKPIQDTIVTTEDNKQLITEDNKLVTI